MEENSKILLEKFNEISKLKWIKGLNNFTNSAGLTFEYLINKKFDSMFFPDFHNIEIKCIQRFSRYPITLFSKSFDGPSLYQMNELLNKYGKNDIIFKDKKMLNSNLSCNKKILVNSKYYFKLEIDENSKKLYLLVYDIFDNLIEKEAYISFDSLKNHLELKLSNLAIVWASKKNCQHTIF